MENENVKKVWTEEERLELAAKLDAELEESINQLEKKRYTEGWPEDRWQEEMEKHPFFMKKTPEPGEELSPLMEGLQQLKYSPDENTPEELANNYKEDGNFNYKHKKYRMAVISYTEGIKTKCKDQELMAQLYNNRAASHYMLKNYRSSLNDSNEALKIKPDYIKSLERAAICSFHVKDYDHCIELCDRILDLCSNDKTALDLKKKAIASKKKLQRDKRKQEKVEKKIQMEDDKIISALKDRGIKIKVDIVKSLIHNDENFRISMDENNRLLWSVIFFYPQVDKKDYVSKFHEDITIKEELEQVLEEPPSSDTKYQYTLDGVKVYFKSKDSSYHFVDISKSLGTVLMDERFDIADGIPMFWVFTKDTNVEANK